MKVLAVDTATESASAAVVEDDKLLGEININFKKQHSVILLREVDDMLKSIHMSIDEIDGFAVSKGPGSFTGLRIGLATIKGFCQAAEKPFIGVSTLDSLAYNMCYTNGIICPILNALRGNVYTALYKFENENIKNLGDYMILSIDELTQMLREKNEPVTFIGDGTYVFKDDLNKKLDNVRFAPANLNIARASSLAEIAIKLLKSGKKDNIYNYSPLYLRKSQAERERERKVKSEAE